MISKDLYEKAKSGDLEAKKELEKRFPNTFKELCQVEEKIEEENRKKEEEKRKKEEEKRSKEEEIIAKINELLSSNDPKYNEVGIESLYERKRGCRQVDLGEHPYYRDGRHAYKLEDYYFDKCVESYKITRREYELEAIMMSDGKFEKTDDNLFQAQVNDVWESKDLELNEKCILELEIYGFDRKLAFICSKKIFEIFNGRMKNMQFYDMNKFFGKHTSIKEEFISGQISFEEAKEKLKEQKSLEEKKEKVNGISFKKIKAAIARALNRKER